MHLLKSLKLEELKEEAFLLRKRHEMKQSFKTDETEKAVVFGKLMSNGKVNPSLRIIAGEGTKGVLPLNSENKTMLAELHPTAKEADPETKLPEKPGNFPAYLFDEIDEEMIWKHALRTQGGAWPSGMNIKNLRSLLSKK